jgi:prophage regulatory protein
MQESRNYFDLPREGFFRLPAVLHLTGLSRSVLYSMVKEQRFPAPKKLSKSASGWRVGEVRDWLSDPESWQAAGRK